MTIYDQIRQERERQGLSRKKFAPAASITPTSLARIELQTASARLETLQRIAAALGCELVIRLEPIKGNESRST